MARRSLWIALGLTVGLFLLSRTQRGQLVVAAGADAVARSVRGLRNNNPGNIREGADGGDQWQGERATDDDPAYEEFTDMRYGVRAAARVFRTYQSKRQLRTVAQMITRWAPPEENDTANYIRVVCKRLGVADATPINLWDAETCYAFLRAVFRMESGPGAEFIPAATIREGIALA